MRVASMVPSWTETLMAAGADVVARTRFCIHPAEASKVPAIGGTKDVDVAKLVATGAELLVLDKEENPLAMAEGAPVRYWASHLTCVNDMPLALSSLADEFDQAGELSVALELRGFAVRWENVISLLSRRKFSEVPAVLEWLKVPASKIQTSVYLIWKNPYMAAGRNTFIGSMLELLGVELETFAVKYPEVDLSTYDVATTQLLFSSEPFPFAKYRAELAALPFASALVDGESLSWFGIRSLQFLEEMCRRGETPRPR